MNISSPDIKARFRRSVAAIGLAVTLLASACTPGQRPLIEIGNTSTPEPTKALKTATPNPTGTPLPTSTPTNTPTQTPTNRPVESATPIWQKTVEAYEKQVRYGALYDTVQMIEFIERQCNYGCYEKAVIVKSEPKEIGSKDVNFNIGSEFIRFTIKDIQAISTYTSERNLTYITNQSLLAEINKILIEKLDLNKDNKKKNYAETRLLDLILGNRDQKISDFNNYKILLQKYEDGTYGLVAYLEVDVCAVVPAPTYTATATPTTFYTPPTSTPIPTREQPDNTPVPEKVPPTPASTVGPQSTPRPTPRLPEEIIITKGK